MVSKRHILLFSALIAIASAPAAVAQTSSSPQFITANQVVTHGASTNGAQLEAIADFNRDGRPDFLSATKDAFDRYSNAVIYTQNADGSFTSGKPLGLTCGNPPEGGNLTVADMNGDGYPDMIVARPSDVDDHGDLTDSAYVCIYLNNGDGTFRQYSSVDVNGAYTLNVTVKDLNGDRKPDLIVTTSDQYAEFFSQVYLNQGGGNFHAGQTFGFFLASGDFHGNGKVDLIVANGAEMGLQNPQPNFTILNGKGDGTFTPGATYQIPVTSVPGSVASIAVGDLNGDHNPDLVVINPKNSNVLLGNGNGTFRTAGTIPTSLFNGANLPGTVGGPYPVVKPLAVYLADFNRDGNLDLAVVSQISGTDPQNAAAPDYGDTIAIFPGNGTGTFHNPRIYNAGQALPPLNIKGNGTGILDFAWSGNFPGLVNFYVLTGDGYGGFSGPVNSISFDPTSIATADFNRDGIPDIAVVNPGTCKSCNGQVSIFPGSGKGWLNPAKIYPIGLNDGTILAGDVNHDGKTDLVIVRRGRYYQLPMSGPDTSVLLGNGNGTFQPAMNFTVLGQPTAGTVNPSAFLLDINHDGKLDLVGDWGVALGKGNGSFEPPIPFPSGIANITSMALADFNRDGNADLAIASVTLGFSTSSSALYTLLGNGKGSFRIVQTQTPPYSYTESIGTADFNKDGIPDLIFTGFTNNPQYTALYVELGKGNGTFATPAQILINATYVGEPFSIAGIADFDRDGYLDVALTDNNGTVALLRGTGKGTFLSPTYYAAQFSSAVVTDLNRDNAPDIAGATGVGVVRLLNTGHRNYAAAAKPPAK